MKEEDEEVMKEDYEGVVEEVDEWMRGSYG